jgi:hypothetical protein
MYVKQECQTARASATGMDDANAGRANRDASSSSIPTRQFIDDYAANPLRALLQGCT